MHGLQMCVRKISGFVLLWGLTCSSLLRSQIFYVYRPRPPAFRYVPIVRGSGVSEQGAPLFAGSSPRLLLGLALVWSEELVRGRSGRPLNCDLLMAAEPRRQSVVRRRGRRRPLLAFFPSAYGLSLHGNFRSTTSLSPTRSPQFDRSQQASPSPRRQQRQAAALAPALSHISYG